MGRGCFYQGGAGKKATQKGKLSEIRCFYRWQEARKATQKGKEPKYVAFPRPEQAEISNKPKIKRSCALRMQQLLF